jgi:predicted phage terminase large subunit-like protein
MRNSRPSRRASAAAELELRRRATYRDIDENVAERGFQPWLEEVSPTFTWDWPHLQFYIAQLDRVTSGEVRKLMVSMAPRHGKTETGTVRYPVYRLERDPALRVIIAAYNQTLAEKFSRKARKIAKERFSLSTERRAAEDWETEAGGGLRAVGVGGGITGMGADLIEIDDPVKSRQEAESEAYRERVYDWYTDDLYTRQEPGCSVILTQTRWHVDDLAGRILNSEDGPNWTVINLPAIAEENDPLGRPLGEALCPERYDLLALEDRRRVLGEDSFLALFQGRPRPAEGGRFKRKWFRYWERTEEGYFRLLHHGRDPEVIRPEFLTVFATVDSGVSEKTAADPTVISVWGLTRGLDLLLLDRVRDRMSDPDAIHAAKDVQARWNPAYYGVENAGIGKPRAQNMRAAGLPVREISVHTDKISRSATAVVRCEAGQIFWPAKVSWLEEWESEHLDFPDGAHDDQVDTTSLAAQDVFHAHGIGGGQLETISRDQIHGKARGTDRWEERDSGDRRWRPR